MWLSFDHPTAAEPPAARRRVRGPRSGGTVRFALLGVLALCAWGCGDGPTGPDLLLSFTVERFDPGQGTLPSDAAAGGEGTVTVTGGLQTPCLAEPSDLKGTAEKDGSNLFLQIRLELAVACTPGVDSFTYEGVLGNLESGTYHLTVSNVFLEQSGYVTLETDVSVQ
jgi:hypothetical protein